MYRKHGPARPGRESEMNLDDFKARVADVCEEENESIDELCFRWLRDLCDDYGESGYIAKKLLEIVRDMTIDS